MTHQHGGRPGSMNHAYVNSLASEGRRINGRECGENSSSSEGKSIYPGIFSKIEKLKEKQLRNILIILFKHYGMGCTIEALVNNETGKEGRGEQI